ncbi:MAG: Uma2 family endonuclease [Sandaracinaceae bacterium]
MVEPARARFTYAEYAYLEDASVVRHEFLDGVVYAMSGGTPEHAALAARVIYLLQMALEGRPCRVFTADLRIRSRATGLGTYPDASVACDELEIDPDDPLGHTINNPALVVEVLSPSTEKYDRGDKLHHYQTIPSLREVLLVAQEKPQLELWYRDGDGWAQRTYGAGDTAEVAHLGVRLSVDAVYADPLKRRG